METSRSGFYAGGDVITGASNMSNAMSGGKQAARKIDERLMNAAHPGAETAPARWDRLFPAFDFNQQAPGEPSLSHRHASALLPATMRIHSQREVICGLNGEEAMEECCRCLRCDLKNSAGSH